MDEVVPVSGGDEVAVVDAGPPGGKSAARGRQQSLLSSNNSEGTCQQIVLRDLLLFVNVCFALAGLVMIIGGAVVNGWGLVKLCEKCHQIAAAAIAFGVLMLLYGIVGVVARNKQSALILIAYLATLVILTVSVFSITVATLVYDGEDYQLEGGWQRLMDDRDYKSICDIQKRFECSGWSRCCGFAPEQVDDHSPMDERNAESPEGKEGCLWRSDECTQTCGVYNGHQAGCEDEVISQLHKRVAPFTVFMFIVLLVIFGGCYGLRKAQQTAKTTSDQYRYEEMAT